MKDPNRFWNPYAAGVALGLVVLSTYVTMGHGIGASSASFRVGVAAVNAVAPAHVQHVPALSSTVGTRGALDNWIVFECSASCSAARWVPGARGGSGAR